MTSTGRLRAEAAERNWAASCASARTSPATRLRPAFADAWVSVGALPFGEPEQRVAPQRPAVQATEAALAHKGSSTMFAHAEGLAPLIDEL